LPARFTPNDSTSERSVKQSIYLGKARFYSTFLLASHRRTAYAVTLSVTFICTQSEGVGGDEKSASVALARF